MITPVVLCDTIIAQPPGPGQRICPHNSNDRPDRPGGGTRAANSDAKAPWADLLGHGG
ncbi:hypothetical protein [Amycolatopsis sp. NPDC004625]|uniref:hypothetical protein n=1 Tax=Amycolatopsis sp. NPDC004625 TaxID=3154670 RepID=UPI0033A3F7B9